jgi:rhodanese-related sulfurtransferase
LCRSDDIAHTGLRILVKDNSTQNAERAFAAGNILLEAVLVAVVGVMVALAANQISPAGLRLARNYFPEGIAAPGAEPHVATTNSTTPSPAQYLDAEIKQQGLQTVDGDQALRLFHDPRFKQDIIVFIDARDGQEFSKGHIPGAYEFDPYHPEKQLDAVLPVCQKAGQIVVYCNGGDCDDSVSAAIFLRNVGIANQKIFVYAAGITGWTARHLPVETGARGSGILSDAGK